MATLPATMSGPWRPGVLLPRQWRIGLGVVAVLLFALGWHVASRTGIAPPRLLPGPLDVLDALQRLWLERGFSGDVLSSLRRIGVSFALAVAVALPLGLLIGCLSPVAALLDPLISMFRYLPAPSFVPLLLMWLGTGDAQKVALLWLGVVWFLITALADVTRQVPRELLEAAQTLGGRRLRLLGRVVLPAALPGYVDACRQMLAVSWTYLVIAEIVAATDGIGAVMMRAQRFVHVDEIMAGILVIGLLGLASDSLFRLLHRLAFPYLRARS